MKQIIAFATLFLLMSGCISTAENSQDLKPYDAQIIGQEWVNNSYQFWNVAPMSMGNTTTITFNETGGVYIEVELEVRFHESLTWEQGHLNYTLIQDGDIIFSHQLSAGHDDFQIKLSNISNITVQIESSGSDNYTDNNPGDWFTSRTVITMKA